MQAYLALGKLTAPSSNTLQPGLGAPPNPTSGLAFTARGRGFALARKLAWKSYHVHKSRKLHMGTTSLLGQKQAGEVGIRYQCSQR